MTRPTTTLVATAVGGIAVLVTIWVLAVAPKRAERAQVRDDVAAQQVRLGAARSQVAAYTGSRTQFPAQLAQLRRLDKAVPARGAVSSMLRELQRRARARGSALRLVALKHGAAPAASAGSAKPAAPGAVAGPGGVALLPFTFEYTGKYLDLVAILRTVRRSVRVKGADLTIDGRLLTIDGVAFKHVDDASRLTKAVVNATAYIAAEAASPAAAPAAQAPDKEGS